MVDADECNVPHPPIHTWYGSHAGICPGTDLARIARNLVVILLLLPVSFAALPLPENPNDSASETSTFEWSSITPTKELTYHTCFGSFQCVRLLVPLDWQASEASRYNKTAALAIIKRPAKVSILDPSYGGAIITNPGGPGVLESNRYWVLGSFCSGQLTVNPSTSTSSLSILEVS